MLAYVSAKKRIIQYIKSKGLTAGDRLPTEVELSEQLDISRLTLREALNALKNDGLIHAVQGRGTFVACDYTYIADSLNINSGVTEMIEAAGYRPGVASFKKELIKADALVAERLRVAEGADVLMCARIRLADDEPVVYTRDYLSPRLTTPFLGVTNENISLYSFIENDCSIPLGVCLAELVPLVADGEVSKLLSIPEGSPILQIQASVNDAFGEPLIYASELFRPDKFKFTISRGR